MVDQRGLYDKYIVSKSNGTPIDPNAVYLVLRLDTDIEARIAGRSYAINIKHENPQFGEQLYQLIDECARRQWT